jgi:hypothetical protein
LGQSLPAPFQRNVETLRRSNPGWEHRLYRNADVEEFVSENFGSKMLNLYLGIEADYGAARADFFRYLLMYKVGGAYLDIKSGLERPLDEIAEDCRGYALSHWGQFDGQEDWGRHANLRAMPEGEFQQWHIVAVPGHRFLRAVLEAVVTNLAEYRVWRHGVGRDAVLAMTGPIAYTLAISPLLEGDDYRLYSDQRAAGFRFTTLPADSHRSLFETNYVANWTPLVRPAGLSKLPTFFFMKHTSLRARAERLCAR